MTISFIFSACSTNPLTIGNSEFIAQRNVYLSSSIRLIKGVDINRSWNSINEISLTVPLIYIFPKIYFFVYKPHRESRMVSPGGLPVYEEKKLWWIGFDNFLQNEKNFKTIHIDPDSTVKLRTIIKTGSPLKYRKFATPWALICCTVSLSGYICR